MLQSNSCCTSHYTRRQWLSRLGSMAGAAALLPRSAQAVKQKPMRGAFMILATPYTASKTIDYEDLAAEVDFLDRCGVHGMVWPQHASDLAYLSKEERMRGMEVIAKAARERNPR